MKNNYFPKQNSNENNDLAYLKISIFSRNLDSHIWCFIQSVCYYSIWAKMLQEYLASHRYVVKEGGDSQTLQGSLDHSLRTTLAPVDGNLS